MKKLFLFIIAVVMCGSAFSAMKMPKHLYVAGQDGGNVKVYNCNTKEVKTVKGYLRDIGVDGTGRVYVLVCDSKSGWGNYYVYENFKPTPYLTLKYTDKEGIFSSAAMKVRGGNVVVCGVQSLGFNKAGYQSRMVGYFNGRKTFETGYDRKSLKRELFYGYQKWVNGMLKGYGEENNSGNPQGDHLSCVYHVDDVDWDWGGDIYATGWGEREYSEYQSHLAKTEYFVRRCPRVWKNGKEIVKQYENRTGAAWNISVINVKNKPYILTSGHQRSQACAWEGNVDNFNSSEYSYPGIVGEAAFQAGATGDGPIFCRVYLCKKGDKYEFKINYVQNNKVIATGKEGGSYVTPKVADIVAVNDGFYTVEGVDNLLVHCRKGCTMTNNGFEFKTFGEICRLPKDFKVSDPKIAVYE